MGTVVGIERAKQKQNAKQEQNAKRRWRPPQPSQPAEHYTEEEELESWKLYARQSWRGVREVKRGAAAAVFKVAYRDSDQGTDWLKACPIDLVTAALPAQWDMRHLEAATSLTELFFHYLCCAGLISEADKNFQHAWAEGAKETLAGMLKHA